MRIRTPFLTVFAMLAMASVVHAQTPEPPTDLVVSDTPDDAGQSVEVDWSLSGTDIFNPLNTNAKETSPEVIVATYAIERKVLNGHGADVSDEDTHWRKVSEAGAGESHWTDRSVNLGWTYDYRVCAIDNQGDASSWCDAQNAVTPSMQLFNSSKAWLAIFMLIFGVFIAYFINHARSGKKLWVRKIAGLEAIDEAVGRATEMGRPVLFVAGIQDINEIQTLAGLTVLSRVAKTAAEYGAQIEVPTCRSLVMAAARETVEAAYLAAGAPDAYQPDKIHYLTDEQFAFVAGVTGYMVREEPAACIYMGGFYAESLILAETGNHIGAIQVAGTAMPSQLPFFVASCDYTLIGEEFFAASAYLSGDPLQIGSLKGQDYGKFVSVLILVIGVFFATTVSLTETDESEGFGTGALNYIQNNMLGSEGLGSFGGGDTDIEGDDS
ncbi:MAG: fibronectin type III domain-containing protein [Phycisphaerales bacterium]|nr:fibronectin type III domain-containing protein [Phycisphaerales bacterium]